MEEERKETVQRALFERNEDELRKADDRVKDMVAQHSLTVPEPTRGMSFTRCCFFLD